jgi:hypothetical protein
MSDWKDEIDAAMNEKQQRENAAMQASAKAASRAEEFMEAVIKPAFEELQKAMQARGRHVEIHAHNPFAAGIVISHNMHTELNYSVSLTWPGDSDAMVLTFSAKGRDLKELAVSRRLHREGGALPLQGITKDDIIRSFVDQYKKALQHI